MARRLTGRAAGALLSVLLTACNAPVGAHSTPTPTTSVDDPCDEVATPEGADCVGGVRTDLDGDGSLDIFVAYVATSTATWGARAKVEQRTFDLDGGEVVSPEVLPIVMGAADVDLDRAYEVFVAADRGASTVFVQILMLERDRLVRARFAGEGRPARFPVAGSVTQGNGLRCREDGRLELLGAASNRAGTRYRWERTIYDLRGPDLVRVRSTTGSMLSTDPALDRFYLLDCAGLQTHL